MRTSASHFRLPIASLALILVVSFHQDPGAAIIKPYNLIQLIPYLLVLAGGIAGIQVFVVLLVGIVSGAIIMLGSGQTTPWEMLTNMGSALPACLRPVWLPS